MKNLSRSHEDYIEAILVISKLKGIVKSIDVAKELKVSKPAVHKAMDELCELGYVIKEHYGDISLTEKGLEIANKIYDKHTSIKQFLINLGVDEETAENDCCKIEHVISDITLEKIKHSLK